jgi:hypothetical protein
LWVLVLSYFGPWGSAARELEAFCWPGDV